MLNKARSSPRREESLTRESIIEASIEFLDTGGEDGLTFRALSERLATGPGAIYWHIANKGELLTSACDAIVARTLDAMPSAAKPKANIRALALGLFDAMDAHPWVGSALARAPGEMPMIRILERLGQQIRALGVEELTQWAVAGALLNYILGVGGRNAANRQLARERGLDRDNFLEAVATAWSKLDQHLYPFTRSIAGRVRARDDRADFLAGIDLILKGADSTRLR